VVTRYVATAMATNYHGDGIVEMVEYCQDTVITDVQTTGYGGTRIESE